MVKTINFQDTFLFIYNVQGLANVNSDYSDPGHNIKNFKSGMTVAIDIQILLQNFKAFKKVDAIKVYLFLLLRIYLVDDPVHSIMSTQDKH